jgi:DNA repair protein RadC
MRAGIAGRGASPYSAATMTGSSMHEVPPAERPRERLLHRGAEALKSSELLAILLRTGTKERPVLELAEFLLTHFGSLEALSRAPVGELARIKGIGQAKAIGLKAAFAIAARMTRTEAEARAIETAADVASLLGDEMRLLDHESVRVICLNTKHKVLAVEEVTRGTLNESLFHPREAYRPALTRQAHAVILVHNHPSGNPQPSDADLFVTRQMKEAGRVLQVELLDHVILGAPTARDGKSYFSFKDEGIL